ncbi:MAG TPA: thaumatin family protein [Thermoanaerobaculia bacterium]|nr:thaumatin family protein [Thermoanaerobaculia bacterium]
MRAKLRVGCIGLLLCVILTANAAAEDFLMWQMPGTGISFPVYVYSGGSQVGYIPDSTLQVFVGPYAAGTTSGSYQLYYQAGGSWYACALVLASGSIDASTTCPGAVINPPVSQNGAQSNVYTVGVAASAWPAAVAAPSNPVETDYGQRTITLVNNTKYPMIQIGQSATQNTPIAATIKKNAPFVVSVGTNGLSSAAFYLSSYCTAGSVAECGEPPTVAQCSGEPPKNWVCTGGYFPGQVPYATKIEATILAVSDGVPAGASNVDVSAVDGYNTGVRLYPAAPTYCTFTVPPENSNVLGAGYYSSANALAQVVPVSSSSLSAMCEKSSQLPGPPSKGQTAWNLSKVSSSNAFEGCVSPCTYATANVNQNGVTEQDVNLFCCSGPYNTPQTCGMPAGQLGANTSTYNTSIESSSLFKNVYGYAFGDAGSDYACPPETNFIVEFVSTP